MLKSKTKKIMAAAAGMLLLCSVAAAETAGLQTVTKAGSNATVQANPKNFTGTAWATSLFSAHSPSKTYAAVVSFTPGARTNWHKHSGGQILLVTAGEGRYQERNGKIRILKTGDVIKIPPFVAHWHGAAPNRAFAHISIETNLPTNETTWLEPVTDEQYK